MDFVIGTPTHKSFVGYLMLLVISVAMATMCGPRLCEMSLTRGRNFTCDIFNSVDAMYNGEPV